MLYIYIHNIKYTYHNLQLSLFDFYIYKHKYTKQNIKNCKRKIPTLQNKPNFQIFENIELTTENLKIRDSQTAKIPLNSPVYRHLRLKKSTLESTFLEKNRLKTSQNRAKIHLKPPFSHHFSSIF